MAPAPSMRARAAGSAAAAAAAAQEGPPCARSGAGIGAPRRWGSSAGRRGRRHALSASAIGLLLAAAPEGRMPPPPPPSEEARRFRPARRPPRQTPACRRSPCHGPGGFPAAPGESVRRKVCRQSPAAAPRRWRAPGQR